MGKKSRAGIRDEHPGSYFLGLKYLNSLMRFRDLVNPGSRIWDGKNRIGDKHPGSATLFTTVGTSEIGASQLTLLIMTLQVQCCGPGTSGTVTFCLSGTGTGVHYGSLSGSGA
jgi:hypothetical protein